MLTVISLGAGVQSTTMALMAARGELPMPDCAIFADTHWEPRAVYEHLDRLEKLLPFPIHRVSAGDIRDSIAQPGKFDPIPWHVPGGMGRRQCTKVYKLYPIRKKIREMLGGKTPKGGAEVWIGISRDEAQRMKPANVQYTVNRWPLIERGMTRQDCKRKLEHWGVDAPRSACCGCAFLNDDDWRRMKAGPEWPETVAISHKLASTGQFMHRSLKPIDEVDLSTLEDHGQLNMFGNECEGICGV